MRMRMKKFVQDKKFLHLPMAEERVEGRLDLAPPIACPGAPISPLLVIPMGITPPLVW